MPPRRSSLGPAAPAPPNLAQLFNLADRAERRRLTPDEAARLRAGLRLLAPIPLSLKGGPPMPVSDRQRDAMDAVWRRKGPAGHRPNALTGEQRDQIRARRAAGARVVDLAAEYGVSRSTIMKCCAPGKGRR